MEFRRKRPEIAIDMTPMIDCVFQLLIFFLLSSSFLSPSVKLKLPRVDSNENRDPDRVVVTIDAATRVFLNQQEVDRVDLPRRLRSELERAERKDVTLRADGSLPYEKVLEMLVAIRGAGGSEVHLVHETEKK